MKNLKVAKKLMVNSLITVALAVIVGVVGIFGMSEINSGFSGMYYNQTVPMPYMTKIVEMLQRQRACMREFIVGAAIVYNAATDSELQQGLALVEDAYSRSSDYGREAIANMDLYQATITAGHPAERLFAEARRLYETDFLRCVEEIYAGAKAGEDAFELYELMGTYTASINSAVDDFETCLEMKIEVAEGAYQTGVTMFTTMLIVIIAVLVVAVVIAMVLSLYVSGLISKPLKVLQEYLGDAGTKGKLEMTAEQKRLIPLYSRTKDEIGETLKASQKFFEHITRVSDGLASISSGDLTIDVDVLSDDDVLGRALQRMEENLNQMFSEINSSTTQVAQGSKQIADGAQSLAQGSTEQAATVEELSSSVTDISEKTKENAEMASRAADLAGTIKGSAEKGSRQMDEMMVAVRDINDASQSISKVIKTIDDIAFQTNILALNAAVEAARAGQHGKGFAVVAEEVRSLAAKSSEAAKDTGDLIANSMEKAELGSRIADETAASLSEIVSGINESSELISQIAHSSEEQAAGITQINKGIEQVAHVVQQNSATAQQSAAASQEMSGQSDMLQGLVEQFKLKSGSHSTRSLPPAY